MPDSPTIDWSTAQKSALVSITTHSLSLTASGPPRSPGSPAVIVEAGLGSSDNSWAAVVRLTSPFARIYTYCRSGLGASDPSPTSSPRTATAIAQEFSALLDAAHIHPPYVLVAHSYGGILAREFLALRPKDVVGMVFVDANQEKSVAERPFNEGDFMAILGKLDWFAVSGLETDHKLTLGEWQAGKASNTEKSQAAGTAEGKETANSARTLGERKQFDLRVLGDYPVSVIKGDTTRDLRKVFDAGVEAGNITEEYRASKKELVEEMAKIEERHQRELLRLSSCNRYVYAKKSGHNVHMTEPDVVANEIKWVLDMLRERTS